MTIIVILVYLVVDFLLFIGSTGIADFISDGSALGIRHIKFGEWWGECIANKTFHYWIASLILCAIICVLWYGLFYIIKDKKTFFIGTGGICISFGILFRVYWNWILKINAHNTALYTIPHTMEEVYGGWEKAGIVIQIVYLSSIIAAIILLYGYVFVKDRLKRELLKYISVKRYKIDMLIFLIVPLYLASHAWQKMIFRIDIPIFEMFILVLSGIYLGEFVFGRRILKRTEEYFRRIIAESKADNILVVVREEMYIGEIGYGDSFLVHQILEQKLFMNEFNRKNIYVMSEQIYEDYFSGKDNVINLDVYKAGFVYKRDNDMEKIIHQAKSRKSVFAVACCELRELEVLIEPYYKYTSWDKEDVIKKCLDFSDKIYYRKEVKKLFTGYELDNTKAKNFIFDELRKIKEFYMYEINSFQIFDFSVKWIEIMHHFYSLLLIALLDIEVEEIAFSFEKTLKSKRDYLEFATFGSWKDLRMRICDKLVRNAEGSAHEYVQIFKDKINDNEVVDAVNELVLEITSEQGKMTYTDSFDELFVWLIRIRNYTRGHGVFTFEITDEINLKLIRIIVYLVKRLAGKEIPDRSTDSLLEKGWAVKRENETYYLYSINRRNEEYEFNGYRSETQISLPFDFRRDK